MAIIEANTRADARQWATDLLAAAGEERHDEVKTLGPAAGVAMRFDVPDDLYEQVMAQREAAAAPKAAPKKAAGPVVQAGDAGGSTT